jgi:zinc protease
MRSPETQSQRTIRIAVITFCLVVIPLLLVWLSTLQPVRADDTPKHYTNLTFDPLPQVQIPNYSRYQLENGLTVYLMEDHELPLVGGTLLVRTGDRLEPAAKVGLATLTGTVLRSGGTQKTSADQLNQVLEQRAASIETSIGETSGNASFNCLTEDVDIVFRLFAETLRSPAFPDDKLALAKNQARGSIARRNDDPNGITSREFQKLIYGNNSPYARTVEYATLDNISREDIIQFHQQYFQPNNLILGVVGDFEPEAMRQLIQATFGDWKSTPSVKKPLPSVSQTFRGSVFFVNQPQLTQSSIQIGHLGGQLDSPDYPALAVMNEVLNGFGGRLFNEVRSRQGLAYSVYAAWSPRYDYPGMFIAGGQTRSDATVSFIRSVKAELEKIRTTQIAPEELQYAKDIVLNSFIFNFQNPGQTLSRLMGYDYYGYPQDFIFRYRNGVEAVTVADVQRVAKTYLKPENLVTLVVGNMADVRPGLASLGLPVRELDVTIPPPARPQGA